MTTRRESGTTTPPADAPATALSPDLSLRQAVRPAIVTYTILAGEQERAGALAEEAGQLLEATRKLLEAVGLVHLLMGPVRVSEQGAVVGQAGRRRHPQEGVAFGGRLQPQRHAQGELADAGAPQGALGGGEAVGPDHHVDADLRPVLGEPGQRRRGLALLAPLALRGQFLPAVQAGDEEEPLGIGGARRAPGVGEARVELGGQGRQRGQGRLRADHLDLMRQARRPGEEAMERRGRARELGDHERDVSG